uniref:Uncharacterized protein n=1 Tax=Manihot esculenta TaxID=3983 RepID=A0A2C9UT97_MANES
MQMYGVVVRLCSGCISTNREENRILGTTYSIVFIIN